MGEFFIVRSIRRAGTGSTAANLVINARPGTWEIPFQIENVGATPFWRRVAESFAPNQWSEERRPVPGKPDVTLSRPLSDVGREQDTGFGGGDAAQRADCLEHEIECFE
jgi:hypothetical protein